MKWFTYAAVFVILLSLAATLPVFAGSGSPPTGECLDGWFLRDFEHHEGEHEGHVGLALDLNKNGKICVKHLDNDLHVHMDDVIRP